jgi:hypothetical protein
MEPREPDALARQASELLAHVHMRETVAQLAVQRGGRHTSGIAALAWAPDSRTLAVGSNDSFHLVLSPER